MTGFMGLKNKLADSVFGRCLQTLMPVFFLFFIILLFSVLTDGLFFGKSIIIGIVDQSIIFATIATAVALIYTAGNLDISIGGAMAVAAILAAMLYQKTGSVVLMVLGCIIFAVLFMLFNCTLSTYLRLMPATVGIVMMQVYALLQASLIGNLVTIKVDYAVCELLEDGPFRYIMFFGYMVVVFVVFYFTSIGRASRFYGGNPKCAQQTGISEKLLKYIAFSVCGVGVGLAGVFTIIRAGGVSINTGGGFGMECMLATVLGGMSIFGGAKSKSYAGLLGALTVAALNKGLLMIGTSTTIIQGVRGVIFLLLVYMCSEKQDTLPARNQF